MPVHKSMDMGMGAGGTWLKWQKGYVSRREMKSREWGLSFDTK